ncbi:Flp pilus assembly protein TadD [Bradyrhizobium sp. S3.3.6]|uniref:Tetratricopeptide repeat protein n=1 Tax=Bradyrhizobium cytisi TaxID=515489 RepID=A0A5S4W0Y8_9BRAD|nr:tetratricopeptide repeat protein [Bradyrhizobium cytisi]TYL74856.1 tetratricopeptide repeat protein [Bradyrhizobium cytisi]
MRQRFRPARLLASASLIALAAASLGGCTAMSKLSDVTGSIGPKAEAAPVDPARAIETYSERYRANPKDPDVALAYGQALRANGQRAQAAAVLEQATIANPGNKQLLAQYGRALADNGNFQQAFDVLSKAHSPDNPDWRLLSVQGTALDQMGRHDEARAYYASALKIAPGDPGVLSNLGLSYMLSRDLPKAEEALRQAYASPRASSRVRQNLGLVVGLQGRFAEAETIVKADLPPDQAAANVAYLKEMLNRNDGPRGASKRTPVASLSQPD